jgi:hypothetical protein
MAGQGIERREILRILTTAAAAATFPGFSKWSFACGHLGNAVTHIKPAEYQPLFFNAPEYAAGVFLNCTDKSTTLSILTFALRTSEYIVEQFRRGV